MNKTMIAYELGQLRTRVSEEDKDIIDKIIKDLADVQSMVTSSTTPMSITVSSQDIAVSEPMSSTGDRWKAYPSSTKTVGTAYVE